VSRPQSVNLAARGARPRGVLPAPRGDDDELVAGQDELGADPVAGGGRRRGDEARAALALRRFRRLGGKRADRVPRVGRGHQRRAQRGAEVDAEVARAPQLADVRVAALGLCAVAHVLQALAVERERRAAAVELEAEGRDPGRGRHFEAILDSGDRVRLGDGVVHRSLEGAHVERRPQLEPDRLAAEEPIRDVHGVLLVRHAHALLHERAVDVVAPHRQAGLEPELHQIARARPHEAAARPLLAADLEPRAVAEAEQLRQVVEHEHPSVRGGQRGDEEPVVTPGGNAGERARGEPSEPIGDQPFSGEERGGIALPVAGERERADDRGHRTAPRRRRPSRRTSASSVSSLPPTGSSAPAAGRGSKKTAACPGMRHPRRVSTGAVPGPP